MSDIFYMKMEETRTPKDGADEPARSAEGMSTGCFHAAWDLGVLNEMSSLGLAHLGDAVYELLVRSAQCARGRKTAKALHRETVRCVSADTQAQVARRILPLFSEEETDVFRRGRNAKPHSLPKHASYEDYALATALEALFGYLYLKGETARITELFAVIWKELYP